MSVSRIYLLAALVVELSAYGIAVPLTIVNADFSAVPILCGGFGWTLIIQSGIGLTAPNSAFQPVAPQNIVHPQIQ